MGRDRVGAAVEEYGARLRIWVASRNVEPDVRVYLKRIAMENALRKLEIALLGYEPPGHVKPVEEIRVWS